eukprot:NODE_71_length_23666_cov_0.239403.p8 type:complete len:285 gc:universal NODE_71_length_23666_cov_0.239403:19544-20398(+)
MSLLSNRLCISCGDVHSRQTILKHYHECLRSYSKVKPQIDVKNDKVEKNDKYEKQDAAIRNERAEPSEDSLPRINLEADKAAILDGVTEDYQNIERVACPICERRFATNAIDRHVNTCQKVNSKRPRKSYDAQKHRVQGTSAAEFVKKSSNFSGAGPTASNTIERKPSKTSKPKFSPTFETSNDNKFAGDQKLAEKSDGLVECPTCSRRFNSDSAERHIPYCAEQARLSVHKKDDPAKLKELQKRTQYKPPSPVKRDVGSFCSNCGTSNESAKKYCINCGYKNQ